MSQYQRSVGDRRERSSEATGREEPLVDRLVRSILDEPRTRHIDAPPLPDARAVAEVVELVRGLVFPGFFGAGQLTTDGLHEHVVELTGRLRAGLIEQTRAALRYGRAAGDQIAGPLPEPEETADAFLAELPALRDRLAVDVQAAYDGDPAATNTDETIVSYPGVDAVFAYRVANALRRFNVPVLPRIITEQAHSRTGVDINPGATIGRSFFIDHGAGVVIGETAVIGDNVKIYQGVTLGAKSFPKDERGRLIRGQKRHPTIGDRVTIYAGAVILGGETTIGDDCVVSGGVFLTQSVPPGHIVRQKQPELLMRTNREAIGSG